MKLAISTAVVNKATANQFKELNSSFCNVDISIQKLAAHVDQGYPFCAQHSDGWRKSNNFISSGFLAVDIDAGMKVEEALSLPYVKQFAGLVYTTPSHAEDSHRFRIVFELETPINNADHLRDAATGLILRFAGDESCKDACRLFFGSKGSKPVILGNLLPQNEIEELVQRAKEAKHRRDTVSSGKTSWSAIRSTILLPIDQKVRTANGDISALIDLPPSTTIHCPKHEDTNASAFTLESKRGIPGLFCSACKATYFVHDEPPKYPFDYANRALRNISYEQYCVHSDADGQLPPGGIYGDQFLALNDRFLDYNETASEVDPDKEVALQQQLKAFTKSDDNGVRPHYDVTFIRSPKGTGKTEWLNELLRECRQKKLSALLIGHRQSLIAATAERLRLNCYFRVVQRADENRPKIVYSAPTSHYAICLDSMPTRLEPARHHYDVVIIDEAEQVVSHLLSSTLRDRRREALCSLHFYLNKAKSVYLLDADLGRITVVAATELLRNTHARTWKFIDNEWKASGRTIDVYEDKNHLKSELIASLDRGEKCFVATNSKRLTQDLYQYLTDRFKQTRKLIAIHSENAQSPVSQHFIRNIKEEIPNYDCVLSSPAMGTGIDISFDGGAYIIDNVFGFFEGRVNTHFDIDQQLYRVRAPKRVCVWVCPNEYRFEVDPSAIKEELKKMEADSRYLLGFDEDGRPTYHEDSAYLEIFAEVTAMQRGSKNFLKKNFIELRQFNGWRVNIVSRDEKRKQTGKRISQASRELGEQARVARIIAAEPISAGRYEGLKAAEEHGSINEQERDQMRRYEIESFYCTEVTPDLVYIDDDGRYRDAVRRYELLHTEFSELQRRDSYRSSLIPDQENFSLKKRLLQQMLSEAMVFNDNARIDTERHISAEQLANFAKLCVKNRKKLELLFNIHVRRDIASKPTQQLGVVLKLIGLRLQKARTHKRGEAKVYMYKVCPDSLRKMEEVISARAKHGENKVWRPDSIEDDAVVMGVRRLSQLKPDPLDRPENSVAGK